MANSLIQRLTFWKSTLRGWWLIVSIILAVWGIAANLRDDFLTPEQQARWVMRLLFPRWYWLVIGFLVITIIAILEGSYRTHAKKVKELNASHQSEIAELRGILTKQANKIYELTKHKLVVTVVRTSSEVFAEKHSTWDCPVVHALIGIRFKNIVSDDIAVEDLTISVCERGDNNNIRELMLTGRKPSTLSRISSTGVGGFIENIAGLMINGNSLSPIYHLDEEMIVDFDQPNLINGQHFLRLTLTAVAPQTPYMVDIEVDWTQPRAPLLSVKPATD